MLLATSITPTAAAQAGSGDKAVAQALFNEALKLMKSKEYAEACPKLEKSQELDPGMGTQYRLAECYENVGRTASAWALFVEVAEAAKREGIPAREAQSRKRAEALEPRLPALVVRVESGARTRDLRVQRDGAPVGEAEWGVRLPIDPGEHVITASAPGKKAWEQKVTVREGATLEVTIPPLEAEAIKPALRADAGNTGPKLPANDDSGSGQRVAAVIVGSAGILGVAAGAVLGVVAKSQWDDALGHCLGGDRSKCDATGIEIGGDAKRSAVYSTVALGVGGAGIAAAVILWLTAPSPGAKQTGFILMPSAGPGAAGAVVRWRF
jgi:hypothetical protein